jgi:small subunit ribosomal protein S9
MAEAKYIEAVGRRKTASARVRIVESSKSSILINGKDVKEYFPIAEYVAIVHDPLRSEDLSTHFSVSAKVEGGGKHSQAEAVRHGIARALTTYKADLRTPLKKAGYLKRDPRAKERKKPGLKKARKSSQWSKR